MDDDGELSLEKPVINDSLILDPITGTMVPNPEAIPDPEGASTPPGFEGGLDSKSSRPKFKSNTPRKPKPNKLVILIFYLYKILYMKFKICMKYYYISN